MIRSMHAAVGLVLLASGAAHAKEIYERPWVEVRSTHFVMTSTSSPAESAAIVGNLEMLREVAQIMTGRRASEHVPTQVFFVGDHYPDVGLDEDHRQVLMWGLQATSLVVGKLDAKYLDQLYDQYLQRYTVFLLRSRQELDLPIWFDQGMQWLVSSARVKQGRVGLGWPADLMLRRLQQAQWIDSRELVTRAGGGDPAACGEKCDEDWRWLFQAQSWLLTHMLVVGSGAGAQFDSTMEKYLGLRKRGVDIEAAFQEAFGHDPRELGAQMQRYMTRPLKLLWFDPATVETSTSSLAPAEVASRLARLVANRGNRDAAEHLFEAALALSAKTPGAIVGLAEIRGAQGRDDDAIQLYEAAIGLEPSVCAHHLSYANFLLRRAGEERAWPEDAQRRALAQEHVRKCIELAPHDPAALTAYAEAFGDPEDPSQPSSLAALEEAYALVPYFSGVQLTLAQRYAGLDRTTEAAKLLRLLLLWAYEDGVESQRISTARALLTEIEERPAPALEKTSAGAN